MLLDTKTIRLIAVGASVAANCQPCLQTSIAQAIEAGLQPVEIGEAMQVGRQVRRGAAAKMDQLIETLHANAIQAAGGGCGCGAAQPRVEVQHG